MENPCKIIFFGDSITKGYTPIFEKKLRESYPEIDLTVINAGVEGETSRDGINRMDQLVDGKPNIVVIGFGMNDWRKGVDRKEFKRNIIQMLEAFEKVGARVILNTLNPSYNSSTDKYNDEVDKYSEIIREISFVKRIKIADINALWKREFVAPKKALRDDIHPNSLGYAIICKSLMWVVPRKNTTILWQYNGHEAKCNYRCPYCYYIGLHKPEDKFTGYIEQWHERFKQAFGNQHLVFYLAFGEPTYGEKFLEILDMVDSEQNWEMRLTSNVSFNQDKIVQSRSAREGRLNINASFHPVMISREDFLKKILFLRKYGIEVPIVYVAYPPYLKHFEEDIKFFGNHGFVVHVRRFIGKYKGKIYPNAYSEKELLLIAKYSDTGTIRFMLNQRINKGWLTFSGLHFFVIDNAGNVGYDVDAFQPYTWERGIFGNIHTGNFRPALEPSAYPGLREGTVDGVANLVNAGYKELENNNVLSFAKQGGVYKKDNGVIHYEHSNTDFSDPRLRGHYGFPPRNVKDWIYLPGKSKVETLSFKVRKKVRNILRG